MKKAINLLLITTIITIILSTIGFTKVKGIANPVVTLYNGNVTDEYYSSVDFDWQGIGTIESTGSRLWASWMRGGVKEPDNQNYIVLAYSDDNGATWVDPYIVIDDAKSDATRMRDPVLWADPTGTLWLFFGYSGTYVMKFSNCEGQISEVTYTTPKYIFDQTIMNKPIVTSWGEWMVNVDAYDSSQNYKRGIIYVSTNSGETWTKRASVYSNSNNKKWHESTIIEKNDGTLWCISRIEQGADGGLEETISKDHGFNWTTMKANLAEPFIGPGSEPSMYKLASGHILFVTNEDTSSRTDLTAFLSCDDGKTWSSLLLDERIPSAYPDICQDSEGYIYVSWDYGREKENEIRFARFTEDDVLKGAYVSEGSVRRGLISKDKDYKDIVSIDANFKHFYEYELNSGVSKETIINTLPTTITYTLDDGTTGTISGSWTTNFNNTDTAGVYSIKFKYSTRDLDNKIRDVHGLFEIKIKVNAKPTSSFGCGSSLTTLSVLALAPLALIYFKKKKAKYE